MGRARTQEAVRQQQDEIREQSVNHLDQILFDDVEATRRDRVLPQAKTGSPLEYGILQRLALGVLRRQISGEVYGGARSSGNCALLGLIRTPGKRMIFSKSKKVKKVIQIKNFLKVHFFPT